MKTYEQIVTELNAKIPRDVISERDGGGGRKLSYLEGHYVINRLNEVLGQGNWAYQIVELRLVYSGEVAGKYGNVYTANYVAIIEARFDFGSDNISYFQEVGYGDGTDKTNPGKAHELASKEAVTDALKRAAKNLGMSMGLALYDKTQENVEDSNGETTQTVKKNAVKENVATNTSNKSNGTAKPTKEIIRAAAKVLDAKKTLSITAFKEKFLVPNGATKLDELDESKAEALLATLRTEYTELALQ